MIRIKQLDVKHSTQSSASKPAGTAPLPEGSGFGWITLSQGRQVSISQWETSWSSNLRQNMFQIQNSVQILSWTKVGPEPPKAAQAPSTKSGTLPQLTATISLLLSLQTCVRTVAGMQNLCNATKTSVELFETDPPALLLTAEILKKQDHNLALHCLANKLISWPAK